MDGAPEMLSQCTGKVGSSIIHRLEKLSTRLPDSQLRQHAKRILKSVETMRIYPVAINHGDLIPSNILVDEITWDITGVVDWAEAEYLPFGTCLYGLELLLGYITPESLAPSTQHVPASDLNSTPTFTYYENAQDLRKLFWTHLFGRAPGIEGSQEQIKIVRDMGILLWYGYAWDDGAISRVVNQTDDALEVACLRAFLGAA